MSPKEQARYRAIVRQLDRMRRKGWTPETHPDFAILEAELEQLAERMTT